MSLRKRVGAVAFMLGTHAPQGRSGGAIDPLVVGDFRVFPGTGEVRSETRSVRLEPRQMELLSYLVANRGRVVSKEELLENVWRGVVSDEVIWSSISVLRRVFEDDPNAPRYIETLRKRGYRLVAAVERAPARAPARWADESRDSVRTPSVRRLWPLGALLVLTVLIAQALSLSHRQGSRRDLPPATISGFSRPVPAPPWRLDDYLAVAAYYGEADRADANASAIEILRNALDLAPDAAAAHAALATELCRRHLRFEREPGLLDEAAKEASLAVLLAPELAAAHEARGCDYLARGWYRLAAASYERALELEPGRPSALEGLGETALRSGSLLQAHTHFAHLDETARDGRAGLAGHARVHLALGDAGGAAALADRLIRVVPSSADAHLIRARSLLLAGKPDAELELLQRCAAEAWATASLHHELARALLRAGRPAEALAALETARGGDPLVGRALELAAKKELGESIFAGLDELEGVVREAAARGDENPALLLRWAEVEALRGRTEAALSRLRAALDAGLVGSREVALDPLLRWIPAAGLDEALADLESRELEGLSLARQRDRLSGSVPPRAVGQSP